MPRGNYPKEKRKNLFQKGHKVLKGSEKGWFKKGHKNTDKQIEDLRKRMIGNKFNKPLRGEKSNFWKGGISTYERKLYLNGQRRALKLGAEGSHTQGGWDLLKIQYNFICPCCGKSEPEIVLTEDHIIPLTKGGSNNIENIQPLCKSCNSKKYNKIIPKYE